MEQDEIDRFGKMIHDASHSAERSATATPRTDAVWDECLWIEADKAADKLCDHARQLERELAEAYRKMALWRRIRNRGAKEMTLAEGTR